ncbi:hypothetical protein SELMODRAFT_427442 [Selaginella moellendorffii]|uniref:Uncharacterized protein n=1 Tax=Selaginella moellendorffii TaxID=88036 RepID=D8SZM7_SELML|nr:hypothetical protein SELMODRAFT_427442 [Selaginella moellendorffii]
MAKRKSSFEVTASSMTRTDFEISNPVVNVCAGTVDKFETEAPCEEDASGKVTRVNGVDKQLLDYFLLEHLLPAMQKAARCYRSSERKLAASFFPLFTHLAPLAGDAELLKQREGDHVPSDEAMSGLAALDASALQNASGSSRITADSSDGNSRHYIDFVHEDGDDLGPWQAVDFRGYGHGFPETGGYRDIGKTFTLLITDSKQKNFVWDPETAEQSAFYQLAEYASRAAIANLNIHRYKPVHMLILADGDWACAVLHPKASVQVEKGAIDPESFDMYLEGIKEKWCQENPGSVYQAPSEAQKQEWLAEQNDRLAYTEQKMKKLRMAGSIPDSKSLLVGTIVYNALSLTWTKFPIATLGTTFVPMDYVLVSGLMRVLFGDRVCSWTKETLQALAEARDKELHALRVKVL